MHHKRNRQEETKLPPTASGEKCEKNLFTSRHAHFNFLTLETDKVAQSPTQETVNHSEVHVHCNIEANIEPDSKV